MTVRGSDRRKICRNERGYEHFLALLAEMVGRYGGMSLAGLGKAAGIANYYTVAQAFCAGLKSAADETGAFARRSRKC